VRGIGIALFATATAGFVLAGIAVLAQQGWWRPMAVAAAAVSLLLFALYWSPQLWIGTLLSAAVLATLLVARWPAPELVGAQRKGGVPWRSRDQPSPSPGCEGSATCS
jgi:hypothetical protein